MPCFALNASDNPCPPGLFWTTRSKIALIVEVIVSYALALGTWIVVFYVGVGSDSRFVVDVVYIALSICV